MDVFREDFPDSMDDIVYALKEIAGIFEKWKFPKKCSTTPPELPKRDGKRWKEYIVEVLRIADEYFKVSDKLYLVRVGGKMFILRDFIDVPHIYEFDEKCVLEMLW